MNDVARGSPAVFEQFNRNAEFWAVVSHSLHTATFIALHRLFDTDSEDNVYSVLAFAEERPEMFSRASLAERRKPFELPSDVHEASPDDFTKLKKEIGRRRTTYDRVYRPIRGKILAHKVFVGTEIDELYAQTRIDELHELCGFFPAFQRAMFHWFHNGMRPDLDVRTVSVGEIRSGAVAEGVQRLVVQATERALAVFDTRHSDE